MGAAMSAMTALVLTAFAVYTGAWYLGMVEGNFALLLMMATFVTGIYWIAEKLVFLPQRNKAADQLLVEHDARRAASSKIGLRPGSAVSIFCIKAAMLMGLKRLAAP
jgi:signal peptidase I